jgi:hypothetical protein
MIITGTATTPLITALQQSARLLELVKSLMTAFASHREQAFRGAARSSPK